jgi:hypothetical protein
MCEQKLTGRFRRSSNHSIRADVEFKEIDMKLKLEV